jgi:hypothetical protein
MNDQRARNVYLAQRSMQKPSPTFVGLFLSQDSFIFWKGSYSMKSKVFLSALVLILLVTLASPLATAFADDSVDTALDWLIAMQNVDGGFSDGFSPESSVSATTEVVIALAAGGYDVGSIESADGASPVLFLYREVQAGRMEGVGIVAKVSLAVVAVGLDPTDFGGQDLVGELEAAYDGTSGSYGSSIFDQALVILALANAGRDVPEAAIDYLMTYQTDDGGWNFLGDTAEQSADTNTTALVIQALAATGHADDAEPVLEYLRGIQNEDGGWPYQNPSDFGTDTDANSTALVLEAIKALGQTAEDWRVGDADPLSALLGLQNESGSFSFQAAFPGDNALATIQAIPAIVGASLAELPIFKTAVDPLSTEDDAAANAATDAAPTPATIPEAGGAVGSGVHVMLIVTVGLLLVLVGNRLGRARKPLI